VAVELIEMQVGIPAFLQRAQRIVKVKELPAGRLLLAQGFQPRQTVLEALQGLLSVIGHDVLHKRKRPTLPSAPATVKLPAVNAKPKPLRIVVLGAGAMGRMHAAAYAQMPEVELVDVPARDAERVRAAIEGGGIDAIDICLPSEVHARFAIPALQHGKHVFCETPMALVLDEAQAMRDAARKAGRLLQVGLLCRSIASYRHVKEIVSAGTHGRLLSLATWRLGSYLHPDAPDHRAHYGDPTTELMTFDLDFANWLFGKPVRMRAAGTGEITALLDYDDGRSASIAAGGLMPPGAPFTVGFRALFEGAVFELQQIFRDGPPEIVFTIAEGEAAPRPVDLRGGNPYEIELRRFVDCIAGKADPALLDAERAIEALELSLAVKRSLRRAGFSRLRASSGRRARGAGVGVPPPGW
jgi:UDP-N-acetylglucosamine 3-dehydrogenase